MQLHFLLKFKTLSHHLILFRSWLFFPQVLWNCINFIFFRKLVRANNLNMACLFIPSGLCSCCLLGPHILFPPAYLYSSEFRYHLLDEAFLHLWVSTAHCAVIKVYQVARGLYLLHKPHLWRVVCKALSQTPRI